MFTHLHVHTEYSLLDGMCRIPKLIERAKELGMDSLALTDHGVMYGAIQFYQAARKAGIKPIIGCEIYIAQGNRTSRNPAEKSSYHLVVLAKDQTGYRNLMQLTTKAHTEGFYYKPRVDKELLRQHSEGLIALSACIGGEVPQLILQGRLEEAKQAAAWYKDTFGDFYLEIQRHPIPELERVNQHLIPMGRELGIPLVATNDVHYLKKEDAPYHDLLLCIGTNTTVQDEKRMKTAGDFLYFKSPEEMAGQFQDIPDALENTERIAGMCNLKLEFGRLHLPEIGLPEGKTPEQFLVDLCEQGMKRHYPNPSAKILERLESELDVIRGNQFVNYILVVWDIISVARQAGILVGVRGSANSSIVLRCLGMTEVDPMEHELVFERFLNRERIEMPDIDLDFQDDRRQEAIDYVTRKYGADHVAQIITFGTLGAKAAIRDVGRALGMSYGDVDRVAKLVPVAPNMTIDRAMEESPEMKSAYNLEATTRKLVDAAKHVEGISRHASTHAAGVVIAAQPLTLHVPLQQSSRGDGSGAVMTQYVMEDIAAIGLLKMDFLGLANLTILGRARDIIKQNLDIDIDLHNLPMDDPGTYKLLSSGETTGVFQLEGSGMRRYIKDLKPTVFSDIAAMVALYRPGPIEHIPTFIKAKHGEIAISYPDPALESILKPTYGVIVYQEQVLFISQTVAGFSLGQADILRKAMGKKIAEVMQKEKGHFLEGAKKNGFSGEKANEIFALIEPFSGYAFNKAHAVSYALIAYQTAYLKANYPAEYITAVLIAHAGQAEKVATAAAECRRVGISILPPDVQKSQRSFSIERNEAGATAIRFGLADVKNIGPSAVEPVIKEREKGGAFKSIEDFCRRCDLGNMNRRAMESLIKAGAFDSLGDRGALFNSVANIMSLAQREQKLKQTGQSTMFDLFGQNTALPMPALEMAPYEVPDKEKAEWERELLGVSFSRQPFAPAAGSGTTLCGELEPEMQGQVVTVIGEIAIAVPSFTKTNKPFISATLEDISGQVEVVAWSNVYEPTRALWQEGNILVVQGKVRVRDDKAQLNCDKVEIYRPGEYRPAAPPAPVMPIEQVPAATAAGTSDAIEPGSLAWDQTAGGTGRDAGAYKPVPTTPVEEWPRVVSEPPSAYSPVSDSSPVRSRQPRGGKPKTVSPQPVRAPEPSPPASNANGSGNGNGHRRLSISMAQTEDETHDLTRLRKVFDVLKQFPGRDEFSLHILEGGEEIEKPLRLPGARYCPELHQRLVEVVGEGGVRVETN